VLLNIPGGGFRDTLLQLPQSPHCIEVGDFNEDGLDDLVVGDGYLGLMTILLNQGGGRFAKNTLSLGVVGGAIAAAVADLNQDGHLDIVRANPGGANRLYLGDGHGSFAQSYLSIGRSGGVAVCDLDGDGYIDLANTIQQHVQAWRGQGDGTFLAQEATATCCFPNDVESANLDGDGSPDLVVVENTNVLLLSNRGDGVFDVAPLPLPGKGYEVAAADLNNDGIDEVIVGCMEVDSLVVFWSVRTVDVPNGGPGPLRVRTSPNPARGQTRLVVENLGRDAELSLYDVSGRLVDRRGFGPSEGVGGIRVPRVGRLPAGLYFARVRSGTWAATTRVVMVR